MACIPSIDAQLGGMPKTKGDERPRKTVRGHSVGNGGDEIGEGNHDADRRYREATERFVKSGAVEPAAQEARRAVEDPTEGEDLKKAEDEARHHADPKAP
jgi:hypothetical protein